VRLISRCELPEDLVRVSRIRDGECLSGLDRVAVDPERVSRPEIGADVVDFGLVGTVKLVQRPRLRVLVNRKFVLELTECHYLTMCSARGITVPNRILRSVGRNQIHSSILSKASSTRAVELGYVIRTRHLR